MGLETEHKSCQNHEEIDSFSQMKRNIDENDSNPQGK